MYTAGIEYGGEPAAAFVHPQVVYRAWGPSQYGKQPNLYSNESAMPVDHGLKFSHCLLFCLIVQAQYVL